MKRYVRVLALTLGVLGLFTSSKVNIASGTTTNINPQAGSTFQVINSGPLLIEPITVSHDTQNEGHSILTLKVTNQSSAMLDVVRVKLLIHRADGKLKGGAQWNERGSLAWGQSKTLALSMKVVVEDGDRLTLSWGDELVSKASSSMRQRTDQ